MADEQEHSEVARSIPTWVRVVLGIVIGAVVGIVVGAVVWMILANIAQQACGAGCVVGLGFFIYVLPGALVFGIVGALFGAAVLGRKAKSPASAEGTGASRLVLPLAAFGSIIVLLSCSGGFLMSVLIEEKDLSLVWAGFGILTLIGLAALIASVALRLTEGTILRK